VIAFKAAVPAPAGRWDAVVVGAGVAGLAAAIHLRRGGLSVVCIEPEPFPRPRVGESLDWSSPSLLRELGLSAEALIAGRAATLKSNIKVVSTDRPPFLGEPPDWWGRRPLGFEVETLHADRVEMDRRLFLLAQELGVDFVWDRVARVVAAGAPEAAEAPEAMVTSAAAGAAKATADAIAAVETAGGRRFEASWFLDAAGRGGRLFARRFAIPKVDYGEKKVCLWIYLATPHDNPGTTFYVDSPAERYLSWIWEIPINPEVASVGCVLTAEFVKEQRRAGRSPREILRGRLALFPRFRPLLAGAAEVEVHSTAYQCHVHRSACGPNWLILGEAAALHDALTGNGVTAAFRHAREGAALVLAARSRGRLAAGQRRAYNRNLRRMGRMFNHGIERAVYDWPIRWGLGLMAAQLVYVSCAFTLNALYTKYPPRRWPGMLTFGLLLAGAWLWIEGWSLLGRIAWGVRSLGPRHKRAAAGAG